MANIMTAPSRVRCPPAVIGAGAGTCEVAEVSAPLERALDQEARRAVLHAVAVRPEVRRDDRDSECGVLEHLQVALALVEGVVRERGDTDVEVDLV